MFNFIFQLSSTLSLMLTVLNLMMIACVIVVGMFKVNGANWTEGPGFFPYGFKGVFIYILNVTNTLHMIPYKQIDCMEAILIKPLSTFVLRV